MPKITSDSIRRRLARLQTITIHISPYVGGLATETRTFVAELNAEAEQHRTGVRYVALADKINAIGTSDDLAAEASMEDTLGGLALRRALNNGYIEAGNGKTGWYQMLKRGNSQERKRRRKHAKTKAGISEKAAFDEAIREWKNLKREVDAGDAIFPRDALISGATPKVWRGGVPVPLLGDGGGGDGDQ